MKQKLLLSLFLTCSMSINSQRLFLPIANSPTFENRIEIQKIKGRITTISVTPIELDVEQIIHQQNVSIAIDEKIYTLSPISIETRGIKNFTITYSSASKLQTMVLSICDDDVKGYLFLEDGLWSIETIDINQYVLVNMDPSVFPNENDVDEMELTQTDNLIDGELSDADIVGGPIPHPIISVLVLYTNDVRDNHPNIRNEVFAAEGLANLAFTNSNIDCKLKVVYVGHTNYDELYPYNETNFNEDFNRFATRGDGYMDEVFYLREKYSADICVLIRDEHPYYCGMASSIQATTDNAFCVVSYNCAASNLSFAHEIGHLIGCRHDLYVDSRTSPYEYGHGYISQTGTWRTIMAYGNGCDGCRRQPYWSNPNVNFLGEPTGNETYCNNAKVWKIRAQEVSHFKNTTCDTITATTLDVINADYAHLFSHYYLTTLGSNVAIQAGNKVIFQAGNKIHLKSGFHATGGSSFHAYISDYDSAATYYTDMPLLMSQRHNTDNDDAISSIIPQIQVAPNPINKTSNVIVYTEQNYENFSIEILDLYGRSIKTIVSTTSILSGYYVYPLDDDLLPKGIMFVALYSNNQLLLTTKISKL